MIIRIVRMTFRPDEVDTFLVLFHQSKQRIRTFEGCHRLELLRDVKEPDVFFTYSWWENEAYLDKYRFSDLFKHVWAHTRELFAAKPQAWSLGSEVLLD